MKDDIVISLENVVLDFPITKSSQTFLKEIFTRRSKKSNLGKFYRAVDNITLDIKKGEVLGIIGPNGAGKSTLLRIIAGIYAPDQGSLSVKGQISLLAGLGAGFQRNMTGKENIFLSGSIYGLSKSELTELIPSIVEYAGIGDFIDQPLRTYSSGMRARLAFSLTSHISPEILLIDEVLSVGDSSFKQKSTSRIIEMVKGEATVVMVSHNAEILREICDRVVCLNKGKIDTISDNINEVILRYRELSKQK
jgi:ABC-type polysaccharide/polyol phosphate transport system ATPase subunit